MGCAHGVTRLPMAGPLGWWRVGDCTCNVTTVEGVAAPATPMRVVCAPEMWTDSSATEPSGKPTSIVPSEPTATTEKGFESSRLLPLLLAWIDWRTEAKLIDCDAARIDSMPPRSPEAAERAGVGGTTPSRTDVVSAPREKGISTTALDVCAGLGVCAGASTTGRDGEMDDMVEDMVEE